MAPVNATPLSQRTLSPFDDTPTRAPSSGHSSLNPLTSLKPQRTRSLSSFATALRPNNSSTSLLADPIEADNTELHRRRVEASFQRQLDSLANANRHLDSSDASSDHTHDHDHDRDHRRRFNDESASSASSHRSASRSSDNLSLGSLRIGLTGSAPGPATSSSRAAPRGVTIEDVEDGADSDSDGHLTYVTERASVLDSPARPLAPSAAAAVRSSPAPKQQAPARAAAVAAPSGGLFGSPRPSVLSHMHAAATSSPRRAGAPPPRNENLPPSPAARPSPSFGAGATSSYPSVAPPRTVAPPAAFTARSPFSPATGPRIGAAAAAAGAGSAYKPKHYSPLNPALNSPLNASPAASTVRGAGSRVHSPTSLVLDESEDDEDDLEAHRMADRTTRTALPDRTGLTDMLRSPKARRGEPAVASASARRASPAGSGTGSGRSAEGASGSLPLSVAQGCHEPELTSPPLLCSQPTSSRPPLPGSRPSSPRSSATTPSRPRASPSLRRASPPSSSSARSSGSGSGRRSATARRRRGRSRRGGSGGRSTRCWARRGTAGQVRPPFAHPFGSPPRQEGQ